MDPVPECESYLAAGYLTAHCKLQHGKSSSGVALLDPPNATPITYCVSFPGTDLYITCPVWGCQGRVTNRTNPRTHFMHRHGIDTIIIFDLGNPHHPHCDQCDMFSSCKSLNGLHPHQEMCEHVSPYQHKRLVHLITMNYKIILSSLSIIQHSSARTQDELTIMNIIMGKPLQ